MAAVAVAVVAVVDVDVVDVHEDDAAVGGDCADPGIAGVAGAHES